MMPDVRAGVPAGENSTAPRSCSHWNSPCRVRRRNSQSKAEVPAKWSASARRRRGTSSGLMRACRSSPVARSEEQTSELQSLMRISYVVLCLTKKHNIPHHTHEIEHE